MLEITLLQQTRAFLLRQVEGLTDAQLRTVPPGFRNHILWNLGHLAVTQQLLHYRLAGLPLRVDEEMVARYRKGTSPLDWTTSPDVDAVQRLLVELPLQLEADYAAGRFTNFQPYATSAGIELPTIEHALAYNNFHEGLHLGVILALKKLVG